MAIDFLNLPNDKLITSLDPNAATYAVGSRRRLRLIEELEVLRPAWGRRLKSVTGLAIVGSSDGQWVLRVNQEQMERLIKKLGLNAAQSSVLADGYVPPGVSPDIIYEAGKVIKKEIEAEYRSVLETRGISTWLRSLPKGSYVGGGAGSNAARQAVAREFGLFWSWVKSMKGRHRFKRKGTYDSRALMLKVRRLVKPEGVVNVPVLSGEELSKGSIEVSEALRRVAEYLTLIGLGEAPLREFQMARRFFGYLGLDLVQESGPQQKRGPAPHAPIAGLVLKGTLVKGWERRIVEELDIVSMSEAVGKGVDLVVSKRLFAVGVQRLFAASGLTIDLECLESDRDHARTTGLVEKAADRARIQLVMAEIKTGGISLAHYLPPRLDNLWLQRKNSPVYDCVVREKMSKEDRAVWEPTEYQAEWKKKVQRLFRNLGMLTLKEKGQLKPQARSIVVNERMENIRLASLLNGAAAGWLQYYMEHHATEGLRSVLSGQVADGAAVPRDIWKELRRALWDARSWAMGEFFERGEKWMGLSSAYRRRLRAGLFQFFTNNEMLPLDDAEAYFQEASRWVSRDPFFPEGMTVELNGVALVSEIKIGDILHSCVLMTEPEEELPWVSEADRNRQRIERETKRTLYRLLLSGMNAGCRALFCGLVARTNPSALSKVLQPVTPIDGPEPTLYLESLEASNGYHLSHLFQLPLRKDKRDVELFAPWRKFSLDSFDVNLDAMEKNVTAGALRQQWAWASRYPQVVTFGTWTPALELSFLRLAWGPRLWSGPAGPSSPSEFAEMYESVGAPTDSFLKDGRPSPDAEQLNR